MGAHFYRKAPKLKKWAKTCRGQKKQEKLREKVGKNDKKNVIFRVGGSKI